MFRSFSLLLLLLFFSFGKAMGQKDLGFPFVKAYVPGDDYQGSTQNWMVLPSQNGNMYFANNDGILEFDGVRWTIVAKGPDGVRSLAEDENGRIYTGGSGKCGFLEKDNLGILQYHSLDHLVPSEYVDIGEIHNTNVVNGKVYFQSDYYILIYDGKTIKGFECSDRDHNFYRPHVIEDKIYVQVFNEQYGLYQILEDRLVPIANSEIFRRESIIGINHTGQGIFVFTGSSSVLRFDTLASTFTPAPEFDQLMEFSRKKMVFIVKKLSSGQLGFGTLRDGMIIFSDKGEILEHLNKKNGLIDNSAFHFAEDRFGHLWIGTDKGINQVFLNSPIKVLGPVHGLVGKANTSFQYKDEFFVGSTTGVLKYDSTSERLKKIADVRSYIWDFHAHGERVYFTGKGLHYVVGDSFKRTANCPPSKTWWVHKKLDYPDVAFVGTREGIEVFRGDEDGILGYSHRIKGWTFSCRWFEPDSSDGFWITDRYNGLFRLKHTKDLDSFFSVKEYGKEQGLPELVNYWIKSIKDENGKDLLLALTSENGVFRYEAASDSFLPYLPLSSEKIKRIEYLIQANNGRLYFQTSNLTKGYLEPNGQVDTLVFAKLGKERIQMIETLSQDGVVLNGYNGAYIYYPEKSRLSESLEYNALIASVQFKGQTIAGKFWDQNQRPDLEFKDNSIRFQYGAQFFEKGEKLLYSYRLDGYDKQWSPWTSGIEKDYNSLFEGAYVFNVKAKNIYQQESLIDEFSFLILPPWYRSIWAYAFYVLLGLVVIFVVARWYSWNLRRKNRMLELTIGQRTSEIRVQKEEIELQADELRGANQKLKELDRFKQSMNGMIVHDLKNPLSAIISVANGNKKASNYAMRMLGLVNNLLDTQKYQNTTLVLDTQWASLKTIFRSAVSQLEPELNKKSIVFTDQSIGELEVFTDEKLMTRVMVNILGNAIKYSSIGGVVRLETRLAADIEKVSIRISDSGPGIPADQLENIFDQYTQVGDKRRDMSTGIGLAFCKMVVEAHGSEIGVSSSLGDGATFFFELTCPKASIASQGYSNDAYFGPSQLTNAEKETLIALLPTLRKMKVFRAAEIESILQEAGFSKDSSLDTWKERVISAAYEGDQTQYIKLIENAETTS